MTTTSTTAAKPGQTVSAHVNEVRLVGRLAVDPVRREMPSGDVLMGLFAPEVGVTDSRV